MFTSSLTLQLPEFDNLIISLQAAMFKYILECINKSINKQLELRLLSSGFHCSVQPPGSPRVLSHTPPSLTHSDTT